MNKAAERTQLLILFGQLIAAISELAAKPTPPSVQEYQLAAARFRQDASRWGSAVDAFARFEQVRFQAQASDMDRGVQSFAALLEGLGRRQAGADAEQHKVLQRHLAQLREETIAAIDALPITLDARLFDERTPFSVALSIGDVTRAARRRVHYFDRYLNADFFPLYLRELDRNIEVRLVTTAGVRDYGVVAVKALAVRAAQEFRDFALAECDPRELHDRNLRIDDAIYFLGTGASGAPLYPTNFAPADSTPDAHLVLDGLIAKARKVT